MKHPRRVAPPITDAEIIAQIPGALRREARERAAGLRAATAAYDAKRERIVVELTNGIAFAFPVQLVPGLEQASPAQRAALALSPSGDGILWERLDTDVSVPGLIRALAARNVGRIGGLKTSAAKAKASKANGAKGGRPRKAPVASGQAERRHA
jgi:hypothetical protein